eukprot:12045803-Karenia_brevis.AAC.1
MPRDSGGSASSSGEPVVERAGEQEMEEEETQKNEKVRALRTPKSPTPEEYRHHRLTHIPYRDWCPHCVR